MYFLGEFWNPLGLRTASSRALRWGCSGGAVGFQEQQEATVVGALWEQDVESSVAFQDFAFILVVKREQHHTSFFPGQIPVPLTLATPAPHVLSVPFCL